MRDYKHFKAQDGAHLTRLSTYLIVASLMALLAWFQDRDNHPFADTHMVSNHANSK